MPKPFRHLTGNGCHVHVSIWDETGTSNLFHDDKVTRDELRERVFAYWTSVDADLGARVRAAVAPSESNGVTRISPSSSRRAAKVAATPLPRLIPTATMRFGRKRARTRSWMRGASATRCSAAVRPVLGA